MAWIPPTADEFTTRFPEFVGYNPALVEYVLDDSNWRIDEGGWVEHDKTPASLNLTAHRLLMTPGAAPGFDGSSGSGGSSSSGSFDTGAIKSRTVGDVKVEYETRSDYVKSSSGGGAPSNAGALSEFYLTSYGRHYLYLMKLNFPPVLAVYR